MTHEAGQSWGTTEKITRMPPPGITRRDWHALLDDLTELEGAGALVGIRAIVAERLLQVRATGSPEIPRPDGIASLVDAGAYGIAAALLAAEIDRADTGR